MPQNTATAGKVLLTWPETGIDQKELFREFVEQATPRALSVAWRLTGGDRATAEDVVQDAFMAAWRALPRFRGDASLDTWFYRILVRRAHNHRRWRGIRTIWCQSMEREPEDPRPASATDFLLRRRILQALDRLTARQREAFVLVHMNGFTVREAAFILRLQPGSVKSHLHRALVRLRTELADLQSRADHPKGDDDESSR